MTKVNRFVQMDGGAYIYVTTIISPTEFLGRCLSCPTLRVREKPFLERHVKDYNPNPSAIIEILQRSSYGADKEDDRLNLIEMAIEQKKNYKPKEIIGTSQKIKIRIRKPIYQNRHASRVCV